VENILATNIGRPYKMPDFGDDRLNCKVRRERDIANRCPECGQDTKRAAQAGFRTGCRRCFLQVGPADPFDAFRRTNKDTVVTRSCKSGRIAAAKRIAANGGKGNGGRNRIHKKREEYQKIYFFTQPCPDHEYFIEGNAIADKQAMDGLMIILLRQMDAGRKENPQLSSPTSTPIDPRLAVSVP